VNNDLLYYFYKGIYILSIPHMSFCLPLVVRVPQVVIDLCFTINTDFWNYMNNCHLNNGFMVRAQIICSYRTLYVILAFYVIHLGK